MRREDDRWADDNYPATGVTFPDLVLAAGRRAKETGRPQRVHDHPFGEPCSLVCAPISTNGHHPKPGYGERSEAVA